MLKLGLSSAYHHPIHHRVLNNRLRTAYNGRPSSTTSNVTSQRPSSRKLIYSTSFLLALTVSGIVYQASIDDQVRDQLKTTIPFIPWDSVIHSVQSFSNRSNLDNKLQTSSATKLESRSNKVKDTQPPKSPGTISPTNQSVHSLTQALHDLSAHFTALLKTSPELTPSIHKIQSIVSAANDDLAAIQTQLDLLTEAQSETINVIISQQANEWVHQIKQLESKFQHQLLDLEFQLNHQHEHVLANITNQFHDQATRMQAQWESDTNRKLDAHGEHLKRVWDAGMQDRLDNERNGRLARLDELDLKLKYLELLTVAQTEQLDKYHRVQALDTSWNALDRFVFQRRSRSPFYMEWDLLRRLSKGNPLITVFLDSVPDSVQSSGIALLPDLHARYSKSVVPEIRTAALLSSECNGLIARIQYVKQSVAAFMNETFAVQLPKSSHTPHDIVVSSDAVVPPPIGFLSYTAAKIMSAFMIAKPPALYEGNDIESILARVEFYLQAQDLDSAARELNTRLTGWARIVAQDWLDHARDHLQVKMAMDVIQTQIQVMKLECV